jgi:hypothetical protein
MAWLVGQDKGEAEKPVMPGLGTRNQKANIPIQMCTDSFLLILRAPM